MLLVVVMSSCVVLCLLCFVFFCGMVVVVVVVYGCVVVVCVVCGVCVVCVKIRNRHDDHLVRLRTTTKKEITSLMNHQEQHVMDNCECIAQDD